MVGASIATDGPPCHRKAPRTRLLRDATNADLCKARCMVLILLCVCPSSKSKQQNWLRSDYNSNAIKAEEMP